LALKSLGKPDILTRLFGTRPTGTHRSQAGHPLKKRCRSAIDRTILQNFT